MEDCSGAASVLSGAPTLSTSPVDERVSRYTSRHGGAMHMHRFFLEGMHGDADGTMCTWAVERHLIALLIYPNMLLLNNYSDHLICRTVEEPKAR